MYRVREYFYSLMTDRRAGPAAAVLKGVLWVLSLMYGAVVKIMAGGYEKNFFVPYKADCTVISIGNITVGGTGKTQAAIGLTRILEAKGKRPAVLLRGYGADEYMMLQEELSDIPILVGPDRIASARRAFYGFGVDTIILDDGFQHWKIARDLDIVLLDATNPFGNYRYIPRGILREPVSALTRADLVIVTKVDAEAVRMDEIYRVLETLKKADSVVEAVYKPLELYEITRGSAVGLGAIDTKKVCIVSSIGNPSYFRQNIARLGAQIEVEFVFLDHYTYKRRDFQRIGYECKFFGVDYIVVTKKDAVKIKRLAVAAPLSIPIVALDVEFVIVKNRGLFDDRLSGLYPR